MLIPYPATSQALGRLGLPFKHFDSDTVATVCQGLTGGLWVSSPRSAFSTSQWVDSARLFSLVRWLTAYPGKRRKRSTNKSVTAHSVVCTPGHGLDSRVKLVVSNSRLGGLGMEARPRVSLCSTPPPFNPCSRRSVLHASTPAAEPALDQDRPTQTGKESEALWLSSRACL